MEKISLDQQPRLDHTRRTLEAHLADICNCFRSLKSLQGYPLHYTKFLLVQFGSFGSLNRYYTMFYLILVQTQQVFLFPYQVAS